MPNFTFVEDMNARPWPSFPFPELRYSLLEFNSRKNCQHLMNWTRWNKSNKVWSSETSLFKWHFHSRRHHCYISSLLRADGGWGGGVWRFPPATMNVTHSYFHRQTESKYNQTKSPTVWFPTYSMYLRGNL